MKFLGYSDGKDDTHNLPKNVGAIRQSSRLRPTNNSVNSAELLPKTARMQLPVSDLLKLNVKDKTPGPWTQNSEAAFKYYSDMTLR